MNEYRIPDPDYPTELIDRLKPKITPRIVKEIVKSDHGSDDPGHKSAIRLILSEDRVPRPIGWEPGEPFSLCQWWEEAAHEQHELRGLSPKQAHVARALSCACLLTDTSYGAGEPFDPMIRLVDSVIRIDTSLIRPCFDMLCWLQESGEISPHDDIQYDLMTAELCKCLLKAADPRCPMDLTRSIPALIESESEYRDRARADDLAPGITHAGDPCRDQWLLGMSDNDMSWDVCFRLVRELRRTPGKGLTKDEKHCFERLAGLILPG